MKTVRDRTCAMSSFPPALSRDLNTRADQAEQAIGATSSPNIRQRIRLLREVATYVEDMDLDSPTLYALLVVNSHVGSSDGFSPSGEAQLDVLSRAGLSATIPTAEAVVEDLLAAGVEDLIARHGTALQKATVQAARAEANEEYRAKAEQLEADLVDARVEATTAQGAAHQAERQVDELRGLVASLTPETPETPAAAASEAEDTPSGNRTPLADSPGIYVKQRKSGPVYEATYEELQPDGSKRRRWKTLGPDLQEAIRAQAKLLDAEQAKREALAAEPSAA